MITRPQQMSDFVPLPTYCYRWGRQISVIWKSPRSVCCTSMCICIVRELQKFIVVGCFCLRLNPDVCEMAQLMWFFLKSQRDLPMSHRDSSHFSFMIFTLNPCPARVMLDHSHLSSHPQCCCPPGEGSPWGWIRLCFSEVCRSLSVEEGHMKPPTGPLCLC